MAFIQKELSDDLLPFSGKLSDRFYEVRQNVADFCTGAAHSLSRLSLTSLWAWATRAQSNCAPAVLRSCPVYAILCSGNPDPGASLQGPGSTEAGSTR